MATSDMLIIGYVCSMCQ